MVVLVTGLITKVITTTSYGIAHLFSPKEHQDNHISEQNEIQYNPAIEKEYTDNRNHINEQNGIQYNPAIEKDIDNNVTQKLNTVIEIRKPVHEFIDRETKL